MLYRRVYYVEKGFLMNIHSRSLFRIAEGFGLCPMLEQGPILDHCSLLATKEYHFLV